MDVTDVMDVVVGGGVVGLAVAWRLAREGRPVTVVDPAPASGASHAAAGMLAPVSEVTYTEAPLLRLGAASLRRWPSFAAELAADAGLGDPARALDLRADGTLDVAFGADDLAALDELAAFMEKLELPVERLTGRECRRLEPMLAPSVRGGLLAPGDAWVDPRRVTAALLAALDRLGVPLVRARVAGLLRDGDRVTGVRLADGPGGTRVRPSAGPGGTGVRPADGPHGTGLQESGPREIGPREIRAANVVLAAGAWSGELLDLPVRPVKGQIMRLRSPQPLLGRCVRGMVHGAPVYLVPRGDGELVLGATQEELGFDTRVTAGGLYELLRDARELVPGVTELEVADMVAGLRPGTPDNLPLIGPAGVPGLVLATGHHRGGVLLTPLTTDLVLDALTAAGGGARETETGETGELAELCSPRRFQETS